VTKPKIKAGIIDLDGTLYQLTPAQKTRRTIRIKSAVLETLISKYSRRKKTLTPEDAYKVYKTEYEKVGDTIRTLISLGIDPEEAWRIPNYPQVAQRLKPDKRLRNMFKELNSAGMLLYLLTSNREDNAKLLLTALDVADMFELPWYTSSNGGPWKPDEQPFKYFLNQKPYKSHEVISVGNSVRRDLQPAANLGMCTAAVNSEWNNPENPDRHHNLKDIYQLEEIVLGKK